MKITFNPIRSVKALYYANRPIKRYASYYKQKPYPSLMPKENCFMNKFNNFLESIFKFFDKK